MERLNCHEETPVEGNKSKQNADVAHLRPLHAMASAPPAAPDHDEAAAAVEVDELLKQITAAKQRELRIRAEKERIRREIEQPQVGTLWTRESEKLQELAAVRLKKEQLQTREREEVESLSKLDGSLKEKELRFRKSAHIKQNAFQQAAMAVLTGGIQQLGDESDAAAVKLPVINTHVNERRIQYQASQKLVVTGIERIAIWSKDRAPTQESALDRILASLNCSEQQQKVEKLQAQLQKLVESRRLEPKFDFLPSVAQVDPQDSLRLSSNRQSDSSYHSSDRSTSPHGEDTTKQKGKAKYSSHASSKPSPRILQPSSGPTANVLRNATSTPGDQANPHSQTSAIHGAAPTDNNSNHSATPTTVPVPQVMMYAPPMAAYNPMMMPYFGQMFPNPFGGAGVFPSQPQQFSTPLFGAPGTMPWYHTVSPYQAPPNQLLEPTTSSFHHPQPVYPSVATSTAVSRQQEQEREIKKLEQQLEAMRVAEELKMEERDFLKLQERISDLQKKISTLSDPKPSNPLPEPATNNKESPADDDDANLRRLKLEHLEALTKVRHERDLIEEQEKLEELKERIQRRKEEKQREMDHEDWISNQKRDLVAKRLQRAIARETGSGDPAAGGQTEQERLYNPENGFVIFWDFATGLPESAEKIQATYAIFEGKVIRTPFKALQSQECEMHGPKHKRCLFASSRHLKKLPATSELRLIIELSSVSQQGVKSVGWIVFEIFRQNNGERDANSLATGFFKVPLQLPPAPDPSKGLLSSAALGESVGDAVFHFRVVHGELVQQASQLTVDPDTHAGLYRNPSPATSPSIPRAPTSKLEVPVDSQPLKTSTAVREPVYSAQNKSIPKDEEPTITPSNSDEKLQFQLPAEPIQRRQSRSGTAAPTQLPENPGTAVKRDDFLDVERLRLLSSASSRPASTRPVSSIAIGKEKRRQLLPVDEIDDSDVDAPWIHVDKTPERRKRLMDGSNLYQAGDGFDVYVDGARCLPENVTITKVTVAALNGDRTQVPTENGLSFASLTSDVYSPSFDMYLEYRERSFNPTLTLVIRVDAFELSSKRPVIVGYALLPVFLDIETQDQPSRPSVPQFVLNEGGFQLPLFANIPLSDTSSDLSVKMAAASPKTPCATLLVRLKRAKRSEDGFKVLSRKDVPEKEWSAKRLLESSPAYYLKAYDSCSSIPSAVEQKIYAARKKRAQQTVNQSLQLVTSRGGDPREELKGKPQHFLALRFGFLYLPEIGFRVAIDGLHNVKAKTSGSFFKVLFCTHPPASFYQQVQLTGDTHFTTTFDWTSVQTSPEFKDGFLTFRDIPVNRNLLVLLDVRVITRNAKTGAFTSQPFGWSFFPVLSDFGSVASTSAQLPLFQGEVNSAAIKVEAGGLNALIDDIAAEKKKPQLVPFADGASVFVRLEDPQVPSIAFEPLTIPTISKMVPAKSLAKYSYDVAKIAQLKKKAPLRKLLPAVASSNTTEKHFEKELNEAFAQTTMPLLMRSRMALTRKRPKRAIPRLQPDDFDDVQYKVEMVRTSTAGVSDDDEVSAFSRDELLEIAFVASVFVAVIGVCVLIGLKSDVLLFSHGALKYVLPMLLLPLAWVLALHAWEKQQQRQVQLQARQPKQHASRPHSAIVSDAVHFPGTKVATF